jgi:6-phosphofructokinase 2
MSSGVEAIMHWGHPEIVTLTANPAIDVSTAIPTLLPFQKMRCAEPRRDPGGGGVNVARVLKRFGMHPRAIYPAGGDTGQLLRQLLRREDIESLIVPIQGQTREDFTVAEETTGRQFRFVMPGPPLSEDEWRDLTAAVADLAPRPNLLIASGSLPGGAPENFYADIAAMAASMKAKFVLDTSGPALAGALAHGAYLIKPNLREMRGLVGEPLDNEQDWLRASRRLIDTGRTEIVALSLADRGALLVTREGAWRGYAPPVTPISTVGAGDSFLGALVWSLMSDKSCEESLGYAIAAGTAALHAPGTDLCRPDDVEFFLPRIKIEQLG